MTDNRLALYFGLLDYRGHYLHTPDGSTVYEPNRVYPGFGWELELLDTGLIKNRRVPDEPDGRVHWVCSGRDVFWHGFFWWDRSGDKRSNSNSGFYVRGFEWKKDRSGIAPAFEYACAAWPQVVARQIHPLTLVMEPGLQR